MRAVRRRRPAGQMGRMKARRRPFIYQSSAYKPCWNISTGFELSSLFHWHRESDLIEIVSFCFKALLIAQYFVTN